MSDDYRSPQGKQKFMGFVKITAVPMVQFGQARRPQYPYPEVGKVYPLLQILKDGTPVGDLLTMIAFYSQLEFRGRHDHEFCLRTTNPDGTPDYGGYQYHLVREDGTPLITSSAKTWSYAWHCAGYGGTPWRNIGFMRRCIKCFLLKLGILK